MALEYTFMNMKYMGFFDVILPFILIFTIVYAILQKVKIFGDKSKNFNIVIALVMGMTVVVPHVMWGDPSGVSPYLGNGFYDVVNIMNNSLPNVSIVLVAILMALIIIGLMGRRVELGNTPLSGWIALAAFALIVYIFGSAAEWWQYPFWLAVLGQPDILALVLVILAFAIIIWFITKEDKEDKPGIAERVGKGVSDLLQK